MDFDLDLAKEESSENPVYYVQYAHARIASILRYASDVQFDDGDVSLLTSAPEQELIREMIRLPELVETAALNLAAAPSARITPRRSRRPSTLSTSSAGWSLRMRP